MPVRRVRSGLWVLALAVLCVATGAAAGAEDAAPIDTALLEAPWPKQLVRTLEVGRYEVRWRQRASKRDGIFAGVRFTTPLEREAIWSRTSDFTQIGQITPGVQAVRFLEDTPARQVIQIDVKVLWKELTLTFEVEREPPRIMRFRLANRAFGEYRGLCVLEELPPARPGEPARTQVELSTWLKTEAPIPAGLILAVERVTMLQATRSFLESCEQQRLDSQQVK